MKIHQNLEINFSPYAKTFHIGKVKMSNKNTQKQETITLLGEKMLREYY